ncbi:MAG TPA: hypothetical protein VFE42_13140 [Chloroflexota bacterium]|nr:hypothetical protein [Chloroflexota bacterium]
MSRIHRLTPLGLALALSLIPATTSAATQPARNPCAFALPSSHALRVLTVSAGAGTVVTVAASGYKFYLDRFAGFNESVHQATGIMPPPGDAIAPFSFGLPDGHRYAGLTNVVRRDGQDRVCLSGVAYRDLGNDYKADRVPPVAVTLDGTISRTFARIDLQVEMLHAHWHYFVYGYPSIVGSLR